MKPEPLKNKGHWYDGETYTGHGAETRYSGKDIKSAVEWLKQELKRTLQNADGQITCIIDEAFEDVMK